MSYAVGLSCGSITAITDEDGLRQRRWTQVLAIVKVFCPVGTPPLILVHYPVQGLIIWW
jgi:hypothetical protein